jgi:hypothetical protein
MINTIKEDEERSIISDPWLNYAMEVESALVIKYYTIWSLTLHQIVELV